VTAPRLAAYDAVVAQPHADAEDIAVAVRSRLGKASTQGIYDALRVLTEQGLVRRIEPAGSPARFEARTGDNHHHVVCRRCGVVGDVDCAVNTTPCLEASETHGFTIDEAEVTYWGWCPACSTNATEEGTT
jgi:Fur family ferric uptake transcriptional regulator